MLNKRNNHIKINKIFNYIILKFNKDRFLLENKNKLDITIYIIKRD